MGRRHGSWSVQRVSARLWHQVPGHGGRGPHGRRAGPPPSPPDSWLASAAGSPSPLCVALSVWDGASQALSEWLMGLGIKVKDADKYASALCDDGYDTVEEASDDTVGAL